MKNYNKFEQDLINSGLKKTKHRLAILEILNSEKVPISAEHIFLSLQKKSIAINFSTVYRTLESLVSKELISKHSVIGSSSALYEYNLMDHRHYLVCLGCKKIQVIQGCPLKNYEKEIEETTDFAVSGHKLNIYGYCPKCK